MQDATDPYAILGLAPSADDVVVHAAWKALLRKHHPDVNADCRSADRAREINAAFAVLGKPDTRAAYDRSRVSRPILVARPRTPYVAPHFRAPPRRHITGSRLFGAALLSMAALPATGAALLAYPDTSSATHQALQDYSAGSPIAESLVNRLEALVERPSTDRPSPGSHGGAKPAEVAATGPGRTL